MLIESENYKFQKIELKIQDSRDNKNQLFSEYEIRLKDFDKTKWLLNHLIVLSLVFVALTCLCVIFFLCFMNLKCI
jgi:hypothetical protein